MVLARRWLLLMDAVDTWRLTNKALFTLHLVFGLSGAWNVPGLSCANSALINHQTSSRFNPIEVDIPIERAWQNDEAPVRPSQVSGHGRCLSCDVGVVQHPIWHP